MKLASTISPAYLAEQKALHELGNYGVSGDRWSFATDALAYTHRLKSVLDYGCGRGFLRNVCTVPVAEYDPAIPEKAGPPPRADLVVCVDVLEHVERDKLANVLAHLHELSRRMLLVNISLRESTKVLSDGRNAHITLLEPRIWKKLFVRAGFTPWFWQVRKFEMNGLLKP